MLNARIIASFLLLWSLGNLVTGCEYSDGYGCEIYWYGRPSQNTTIDAGQYTLEALLFRLSLHVVPFSVLKIIQFYSTNKEKTKQSGGVHFGLYGIVYCSVY